MLVIICTWKSQRMGTSNLMLMLISWTWGCTTFHNFISMFKKKIKSWQVCDWLAKWSIMSGYMDLRRPRVYRRSSVGLVIDVFFELWIYNVICTLRLINHFRVRVRVHGRYSIDHWSFVSVLFMTTYLSQRCHPVTPQRLTLTYPRVLWLWRLTMAPPRRHIIDISEYILSIREFSLFILMLIR